MKKKAISLFLGATILAVAIPMSASANYHPNGRSTAKFNAFYDASVASYGYTGIYDTARASWGGISSKVAIGKTTSSSGLPDKYYVGTSTDPTLLGLASYYDGNSQPVSYTSVRAYTTVASYDNNLQRYEAAGSNSVRVSNAIHELGHSLSLGHTTDPNVTNSVMFEGAQTIGPQQYDQNQLKAKWGI